MKIKDIKDIEGVMFTGGTSFRFVLKQDNVGFALMKTVIPKGGPYHWHYIHHNEACYCVSGGGIITDMSTGERHIIKPDMTYILDNHDDHSFEATEDTVLISVFNPPLTGQEKHDENGHYSI